MTTMTTERLGKTVGATIVGLDAERLVTDESLAAPILDALEENGVLVFRDLFIDDDAQVAFSQRLGRCETFNLDAEHPGPGLEGEARAPGLLRHPPADAAHAVAAGFRLRAVGIVDAHVGLGAGGRRIVQHHHLVEARLRPPGDRARLAGREHAGRAAQVHDHDLVAETVHLGERDGA